VVGCRECSDKTLGSGSTELVSSVLKLTFSLQFDIHLSGMF
jgi:hypothetical protein